MWYLIHVKYLQNNNVLFQNQTINNLLQKADDKKYTFLLNTLGNNGEL